MKKFSKKEEAFNLRTLSERIQFIIYRRVLARVRKAKVDEVRTIKFIRALNQANVLTFLATTKALFMFLKISDAF